MLVVARALTMTRRERLAVWMEERSRLGAGARGARATKRVPQHRYSVFYYLGGMTLFLFLVQVVTGILLLLYYRPSSTEAFESVQYMMTNVPFGWLVRSIHSWSANVFVGAVHPRHLRLLPQGVSGAARADVGDRRPPPSSPSDSASPDTCSRGTRSPILATKVGTDVPAQVPVIGHLLARILRGGSDVTGATLSRFYGLHVAILPAITTAFLGLHLILVQRQGMSRAPPGRARGQTPRTMPFVPDFLMRDMVGWLAAIGVLAALAAFLPAELGVKANPFAPAPAGIRPEWFFLWMFQGS